jgi:hypothetical protein
MLVAMLRNHTLYDPIDSQKKIREPESGR